MGSIRKHLLGSLAVIAAVTLASAAAVAQQQPNIVIIWGDDIGISDISAYSHSLMGFQTPNIDRIANQGIMFTDYYGEQRSLPPAKNPFPSQNPSQCESPAEAYQFF